METSPPLISVIIPAYNAERFIAETLDSVINQTFQNLEILVVNDGSTDATADIVQDYADKDARITLIHQHNAGVAAARNHAIQRAQGEFIAPIDADDIWFPECLESELALMAEPTVGMAYAWSVFIDDEGKLLRTCQSNLWQGNDFIPLIYRNLPGNASCVLLRHSCLQSIGGYDSSYLDLKAQGCEDWDLYLRLAECFEVRVVPRILVGYRQVNGSMSTNPEPMRRGVDLILDRLIQRHPEIDPRICDWNRSIFAWYLAVKCSRVGNYSNALIYMKRSLSLDYFPLFRINFYKLGFEAILNGLFHPFTAIIWPDHESWLSFQKSLTAFLRAINPFYGEEITLEKLQCQQLAAKRRFPGQQYEMFVAWRCDLIRKQAQEKLSVLNTTCPLPLEADSSI